MGINLLIIIIANSEKSEIFNAEIRKIVIELIKNVIAGELAWTLGAVLLCNWNHISLFLSNIIK